MTRDEEWDAVFVLAREREGPAFHRLGSPALRYTVNRWLDGLYDANPSHWRFSVLTTSLPELWSLFSEDDHAKYQRRAIRGLVPTTAEGASNAVNDAAASDQLTSPASEPAEVMTFSVVRLLQQDWPDSKSALDCAIGNLVVAHLRRGYSPEELFERMRSGVLDPQQQKVDAPAERLVGLLTFLNDRRGDEGQTFELSTPLIAQGAVSNRILRRIGARPLSQLEAGRTAPYLDGEELVMASRLSARHSMTAFQMHRKRAGAQLGLWLHDMDIEVLLGAKTAIRSGQQSWARDVSMLRPFRYLPRVSSGDQQYEINSAKTAFLDRPIDAIFYACRAFDQRFGKDSWRAVAEEAVVGANRTALELRLIARALERLGPAAHTREGRTDENEQPLVHQRVTGQPQPCTPYLHGTETGNALAIARGLRNRREHAPIFTTPPQIAEELARLLIEAWHLCLSGNQ